MSYQILALLNNVTITSANKYLEVDLNPAGAPNVQVITLTEKIYDDVREIMSDLETGLQVHDATFTVTMSTSPTNGTVRIARNTDFDILWKTGAHGSDNADDHCGDILGYKDDKDSVGAAYYVSNYQHMHGWYANAGVLFDSKSRLESPGAETFVACDGTAYRATWNSGDRIIRQVDIQLITAAKFFAAEAATNEDFETWWQEAAEGVHFKLYMDAADFAGTDEGTWALKVDRDENLLDGVPRHSTGFERYSKTLYMQYQG